MKQTLLILLLVVALCTSIGSQQVVIAPSPIYQEPGAVIFASKGDSSDVTTALRTALALAEDKGYILVIDSGVYVLTDSIYVNNCELIGRNATLLFQLTGEEKAITVGSNVVIRGFIIDVDTGAGDMTGNGDWGAGIAIGKALDSTEHYNIELSDLTITCDKPDANGILLEGFVHNVKIDNIKFPSSDSIGRAILVHWAAHQNDYDIPNDSGTTYHPNNITISNITIDTLKYSGGITSGIYLSAVFNVDISNVSILKAGRAITVNSGDVGYRYASTYLYDTSIIKGQGIEISGVNIKEAHDVGFYVVGVASVLEAASLDSIFDLPVHFSNSGLSGDGTADGVALFYCKDVVIDHCTFEEFQHGLSTGPDVQRLKVLNSFFFRNQKKGIAVSSGLFPPNDALIQNNYVVNNNLVDDGHAGIYIGPNSARIVVDNNRIGLSSGEGVDNGIEITGSDTDLVITNNHVFDAALKAFYIRGDSTTFALWHNNTSDIAGDWFNSTAANLRAIRKLSVVENDTLWFGGWPLSPPIITLTNDDYVLAWDSTNEKWIMKLDAGSAGGETNTLADTGASDDVSVFGLTEAKAGVQLRIRTLEEGANITLSQGSDSSIIIAASGGGTTDSLYIGTGSNDYGPNTNAAVKINPGPNVTITKEADSSGVNVFTIAASGNYLPLGGGQMTGNITMAGAETVDGVDVSNHSARHEDAGADELAITAGMMNTGTSADATTFWRGDNTWVTPSGTGHNWTDSATGPSSPHTGEPFWVDSSVAALHADSTNIVHFEVYNNSGSTILRYAPVYVSGWQTGGVDLPRIALAQANSASTMPAEGIVDADIANGSAGTITSMGHIMYNTTSIEGTESVDDPVYVSPLNPGVLTVDKPSGDPTYMIQKVGVILQIGASGELIVSGAGRSNDVPLLEDAKLWVGNGSDIATAVTMSQDATMDNTGAVTIDHGNLDGLGDDDHSAYGALSGVETIAGNWVNTNNPWADNEVVDALTIAGGTIATTPINLVNSATPTPTVSGRIEWGTDNTLAIGDGSGTKIFSPDAVSGAHHTATVAGDLDHGGIGGLTDDDHTQYLKESDTAAFAITVADVARSEMRDSINARIDTLMLSITIDDPDALVNDTIIVLNIRAETFPTGITITDCGIVTRPSSSYTVTLYETTVPNWSGTESVIEAVSTSTSSEAEDNGTIDDGAIAAGTFIMAVTSGGDLDQLEIWIAFYVN